MPKTSGAVAEIAALIPDRAGVRPWWERVDASVAALLPGVLQAWHDGEFGVRRRPAAKAIASWLNRSGVEIGVQGVEAWLRRNEKR